MTGRTLILIAVSLLLAAGAWGEEHRAQGTGHRATGHRAKTPIYPRRYVEIFAVSRKVMSCFSFENEKNGFGVSIEWIAGYV